jgi:primosomal protein N' (replication factor Y)
LPAGTLVRVPLGQRDSLGLVWPSLPPDAGPANPDRVLKPIAQVLEGIAPLSAKWLKLVDFAAHYYQRSVGEFALACLPPQLRELSAEQLARKLKKRSKAEKPDAAASQQTPEPTPEQAQVLARMASASAPRRA